MNGKIYAPWPDEVVLNLNAFQLRGEFHPFTCGIDSDHGSLIALPGGWICPDDDCDYTQNWAHEFMGATYPSEPGRRGDMTVTADGSWWRWVALGSSIKGRWCPLPSPVRAVSEP